MKKNTQQTVPEGDTASEHSSSNMVLIIVALIVAAAIIGGVVYLTGSTGDTMPAGDQGETGDTEDAATLLLGTNSNTGPVARVNGVDVARERYERDVVGLGENAQSQGADLTDPAFQNQIRDQVLTGLINTELIMQAANAAGITVTNEAVEERINEFQTGAGGADAFAAQIAAQGFTDETLRESVRMQLIAEAYFSETVDTSGITVTDEEVTELYDALFGTAEEAPELQEVREQLTADLTLQKEQELILEEIERLRSEANIEELV